MPGCAGLHLFDAGSHLSVDGGGVVRGWREASPARAEVEPLVLLPTLGTLGLAASRSGRLVPNFTGTQVLSATYAASQRNADAARKQPDADRWIAAVIYESTVGAGFPVLAGRYNISGTAQQQWLLLQWNNTLAKPAVSINESGTLTEIGQIAGANGNDGNAHVLMEYVRGTQLYARLDRSVTGPAAIAGVRSTPTTEVFSISNANAGLRLTARVCAVVFGWPDHPGLAADSIYRWAVRRWLVSG